jgi:hypothetical protein
VQSNDCGLANSSEIQAIVSPSAWPMSIVYDEKLAAAPVRPMTMAAIASTKVWRSSRRRCAG